jgi:hypothetical protein
LVAAAFAASGWPDHPLVSPLQAGGLSRPMPFLLSIWYYQWQSSVKRFLAAGSHRNCVNPSGFSWFYKHRRSFSPSDWRFRSNPA